MPAYCTAQEVSNFIRLRNPGRAGGVLQVSENSDPSITQINELIDQNEDILNERIMHSWKETTIRDEMHDIVRTRRRLWGRPVHLYHRSVRTIDADAGDKVEIWDGDKFIDITDGSDHWRMDYVKGILYVGSYWWGLENRVRISYRYGDATVPAWVKRTIIKMVSIDLVETSLTASKVPTGGENMTATVNKWRADIERVVADKQEVKHIEF